MSYTSDLSAIRPSTNRRLCYRFQLVEYPSEGFQRTLMTILVVDVAGTLIWDRLMLLFFAPDILFASMKDVTFSVATSSAVSHTCCLNTFMSGRTSSSCCASWQ